MKTISFYMTKFLIWFFSTPTAFTGLISIFIAFSVYQYQRNEKRKYNAFVNAEYYSKYLLPKIRFIHYLLEELDLIKVISCFNGFTKFTTKEVRDFLSKNSHSNEIFNKRFQEINLEKITIVLIKSKNTSKNFEYYTYLDSLKNIELEEKKKIIAIAFEREIVSFLNDLEAFSMSIRYNLIDEKVVYQSLHQTFLDFIPEWYYHLAIHNDMDEARIYTNVIWVYKRWNNIREKQRKKANLISKLAERNSFPV